MEVDRKLLNPHFEGYKLSFDASAQPSCDFFDLECEVAKDSNDKGSKNEFQLVADRIYENKLKSNDGSFFYLNSDWDLMVLSKSLKSALKIPGPFKSFAVAEEFAITFGNSGSFELIYPFKNEHLKRTTLLVSLDCVDSIKFLSAKVVGDYLITIIQRVGLVKDVEGYNEEIYGKIKEKSAFSFMLLSIPLSNPESGSTLKKIGWSHSRPLINFILPNSNVIIGTNTGLTCCEGFEDVVEILKRDSIVNESDFVPSDEDEDGNESFNDCVMFEFSNLCNKISKTFPEVKISGESVKDLQVASKYLYDVIVNDLTEDGAITHVSTFPAIDFIQSGKIDRKFSIFGKEYAFILESGGNVYCYAKPALKQTFAPQFLVQLDEEIFGWSHEIVENGIDSEICENLFILSLKKLYKISLKRIV